MKQGDKDMQKMEKPIVDCMLRAYCARRTESASWREAVRARSRATDSRLEPALVEKVSMIKRVGGKEERGEAARVRKDMVTDSQFKLHFAILFFNISCSLLLPLLLLLLLLLLP